MKGHLCPIKEKEMKKMLTIIALLGLSATAFAHGGGQRRGMRPGHHGKFAKAVVKGPKAQAIFEALNADIISKDRPNFSVEVKKVGSLRCAQLTKKADTTVVKYRCALKGGKKGPRWGRRHGRRHGMRPAWGGNL